jgi:hypothetical protein
VATLLRGARHLKHLQLERYKFSPNVAEILFSGLYDSQTVEKLMFRKAKFVNADACQIFAKFLQSTNPNMHCGSFNSGDSMNPTRSKE